MNKKIKRVPVLAKEIVDTFLLRDGVTRLLKSVIDERQLNIRYRTGESRETIDFILLHLSEYMVTHIRPNSVAARKIINTDSNSERPVLEIIMEQIRNHTRKYVISYVTSVVDDIVMQQDIIAEYIKKLNMKIITAGILEKIVKISTRRYSHTSETIGTYSEGARVARQIYTYSKKIDDPRMKLVGIRDVDTGMGPKKRYDYIW